MHTRIVRVSVAPTTSVEQIAATYVQRMTAAFGNMPGYIGCGLLAGVGDSAASITYWADAESMQASDPASLELRSQFASEGVQVNSVDTFEFVIQERTVAPRSQTFLRTTQLTLDTARIDELIESMSANTVPLVKLQPGFLTLLVGANKETAKVIVASIWDSAATREASEAAVRDERRQIVERVGASVVSTELYESVAIDIKLRSPA